MTTPTPTPRTDDLVRELKRIKASDWTIDLIALAQSLERDLAAAQSELAAWKKEAEDARAMSMDISAAQEALRRANTPIANVTLSGDAQYWQDRAQRAEALAESNARDAKNFAWLIALWPLEITRLVHSRHTHGPTSSEPRAAIDAAREGK